MKGIALFNNLEDLDAESKYLVHKAKEATQLAYAPYSRFQVGAALLLDDGTLVMGANQENASYPLCMCAERVALYSAATQYPGKSVMKIAVVAHKKKSQGIDGCHAVWRLPAGDARIRIETRATDRDHHARS